VYSGNSLLTFQDLGQPIAPNYKGQEILGGGFKQNYAPHQ
jgi:hypothetical protein